MGQGPSKPSDPDSGQHVFTSETPVRFSQQLIDSLQQSPETDNTRATDLELHIQSRVAAELTRLAAEQDKALADLSEQISAPEPPPSSTSSTLSSLVSSLPGTSSKSESDKLRDLGRQSVQKEIEELKSKLEKRRLREDVVGDKAVEKAKREVVTCLRINDRRPLDCWREVEAFKREVGRLEREFLGRVLE